VPCQRGKVQDLDRELPPIRDEMSLVREQEAVVDMLIYWC
jgi:hypothetical protein